MHANVAEDAEHVAVFGTYVPNQATGQKVEIGGLVPDSSVTVESLSPPAAGPGPAPVLNWSDPNSWVRVVNGIPQSVNGSPVHVLPKTGDNVLIADGTTVMVDGDLSAASLHAIRVDGTLTFSTTVNTKLLVDTIVVEPQGTWIEGTAASPIPANVTAEVSFADNGDINTTWDPGQFSRGLLTHGNVSLFGSEVASYYAAASTRSDGSTAVGPTRANATITLNLGGLAAPQGWKVGDRLIVTGDTAANSAGVNQDEQVSIAAINGNVIMLAQPLKYAHTAPAGQSIYVSDVTRNVVFDSQSIALGDNTVAHRGHTMVMHRQTVHMDAVGFYGLGRTDKRVSIDDPNPVEDVLAEQALAANPAAGLPADDYYVIATNPTTGAYLGDANGNPIYAKATDANGKPLLDINGNPVLEVMTTDVLDSKTGQRVMVPVMDANGKPIPLYLTPQSTEVAIPTGQPVPTGDTPLYQLTSDGSATLKDSKGNPVPQYELQVAKSGLNPRGRYAVHFHRTGTDPSVAPASINDGAVVDSPGWGIVNHSSDVNVTNNVVFNALGAAYVTATTVTTTSTVTNAKGVTSTVKTSKVVTSSPQQYDIYLQSKFDPRLQDITTLFNPDVVRLGTVMFKGQQLYYLEQAAGFVPLTADLAAQEPFIPQALVGLTNQQMFTQYGLAIGGVLAPSDATTVPQIHGLVGSTLATYLPQIALTSAKYTQFDASNPSYTLTYKYLNPGAPGVDRNGYVTVKETTKRQFVAGWNLLQIASPFAGAGQPASRTLLVYGDDTAPTLTLDPSQPLVINRADLDNGSTYYIKGTFNDDSIGSKVFQASFKLNDPNHVKPAYLADGTTVDPDHVWLDFGPDEVLNLFWNASVFPDDARRPPYDRYNRPPAHYVNYRIMAEQGNKILPPIEGLNVINSYNDHLREVADPKTLGAEKALALSWIFHQAGDIHMPLHAVARFSKALPEGDRGGNSVIVPNPRARGERGNNLHAYWDDLIGDDASPAGVAAMADRLMAEYPRSAFARELPRKSIGEWAEESVEDAVKTVYRGLDPEVTRFETLPPNYEAEGRAVADRRGALAGYRLGDELKRLFVEQP